MTTSAKKTRFEESKDMIKRILHNGDTVYCILRSVSKSGMSRRIDFYVFKDGTKYFLTNAIAEVLGLGYNTEDWRQSKGARVNGCGMDMGFACVNDLGAMLNLKIGNEWL